MAERSRSILILGGSTMQLPAIRIARRKGWRVVVADANPEAEGRALADDFLHVDLKDLEGLEREARIRKEAEGLDGVFTAGTDFSASVAWVAERLGLPGIPYQSSLDATDKARMREVFSAHGVPHPRFARLGAHDDPRSVLGTLNFPLVVKPVDNMGSRGVRRVDSEAELEAAHAQAAAFSRSSTVIVEEYMEGPELSLDAVVHQGEVTICGVADRHIFFPPFFVEMGHTMPSELDPAVLAEVERVFRAGVRALGIHTGAAKGDVKLTPEGARIGEIAARLSGGYMSGWTYPYASGVEATEGALQVAVGLPPGDLRARSAMHSAERAFISLPGIVSGIMGLSEARGVTGVRNVFVRTRAGLREVCPGKAPDAAGIEVAFPTNNVQMGNVSLEGATRAEAVRSAGEALCRIFVRLTPDVEATSEFLLGPTRLPDVHAYELRSARARAELEALPRSCGGGSELAYLPFDLPEIEGRDWHGKRAEAAFREVVSLTGIVPYSGAGRLGLGKAFWRAFMVGGAQGAVYVVDTVRSRLRRRLDCPELI